MMVAARRAGQRNRSIRAFEHLYPLESRTEHSAHSVFNYRTRSIREETLSSVERCISSRAYSQLPDKTNNTVINLRADGERKQREPFLQFYAIMQPTFRR